MQRTAESVANVLTEIYTEKFDNDSFEQYRLEWSDLRMLSGGRKITNEFIADINDELTENNQVLVAFDNFLALLNEQDCSNLRKLSGRILEKYLYEEEEISDSTAEDNDLEDGEMD